MPQLTLFYIFLQDTREKKLKISTTLYVGNLSFYTNEEQVFALFSRAGEVKRIVMGLDRIKKTPCGFCFVEYFTRTSAEASVNFLSGSKLDGRVIRVDYDTGFEQGRQFGRGRSGGQVRDEYRTDFDPGRGGHGRTNTMSGMQLWGGNDMPPQQAHNNNHNHMRRRGRGGYRGGHRGGAYNNNYQRGKRRRNDYEEDHRTKLQRLNAPLGSGPPRRRGGYNGYMGGGGGMHGGGGMPPQVPPHRQDRMEEEVAQPTRNARFDRGRDNDAEADD